MKKYAGKVVSGKGQFSYWIERLSPVYTSKLGTRLFPGTLNVDIDVEYRLPPSGIIRISAEETAAFGGSVNVSVVHCRINGIDAFVLRTDGNELGTGDHPRRIVEIASAIKLRDHFNLLDGSIVQLELP